VLVGIRRRLERLEERHGGGGSALPGEDPARAALRSRMFERLFHAFENGRRELDGLEPMPDLDYTEEDRRIDAWWLDEGIPTYRRSGGWRGGEGQRILDLWQEQVEERLKGDSA
jgi:hypothetical protein